MLGAAGLHGKPAGFPIATVQHLVACVVKETAPMVTDEEGLNATRLLAAIAESAGTGRRVEAI